MPAIIINGKTVSFKVEGNSILVDGRKIDFSVLREAEGKILVQIGGAVEEIILTGNGDGVELFSNNATQKFEVLSDRDLLLRSLERGSSRYHAHSEIKAPMPGLVVKTLVKKGDTVKKGTSLLILEAMKMENEIRTPADAEVAEVLVKDGDIVDKDQTIVRLA